MKLLGVSSLAAALLIVGLVQAADPGPAPAPAPTPPGARSYRPIPPPANFSPPILEVDSPDFDWGTTLQGDKVRHDFVFKNVGGSPAVISQVRPGCGCTLGSKPDAPIEPGKTGVVTLEINTKGFSGQIKKSASIYSNAKPSPMTIYIGGKVDTFFSIDPPNLRAEIIKGNPPVTVKATLKKTENASVAFALKQIRTESKVVKASVIEVEPGKLYEIQVTADVGADERKYFYEKIQLVLDVGGKPMEQEYNVSVTVKDRIDIQPRTSVYFSRTDTQPLKQPGAQPVAKTLDIVSLGGPDHKFDITGVTTAPAPTPALSTPGAAEQPAPAAGTHYFDTKVETVEPGKKYRLSVLLPKLPEGNLRTIRERLLVQTNDPSVKELAVTVMAAVY